MSFSKWRETVSDENMFLSAEYFIDLNEVWNAAIDEAIKVVSVKDYMGQEQYSHFIEKLEQLKE